MCARSVALAPTTNALGRPTNTKGRRLDERGASAGGWLNGGPSFHDACARPAQLRSLVSLNKRRYRGDGFDLDLTYVTNCLIAMGFPSVGIEGAYRNAAQDCRRFLQLKHGDHYKVRGQARRRAPTAAATTATAAAPLSARGTGLQSLFGAQLRSGAL